MSNRKIAVTLIGLFAASVAFALPEFSRVAPKAGVDTCIAEVGSRADFTDAASVVHEVETEDRRVSGHRLSIRTLVYAADGETVIREYATACAINDEAEIKRFRIRRKGG